MEKVCLIFEVLFNNVILNKFNIKMSFCNLKSDINEMFVKVYFGINSLCSFCKVIF